MTAAAAHGLITGGITDFGGATLIILTAVLSLVVGLLVFRWGWRKIRGAAH